MRRRSAPLAWAADGYEAVEVRCRSCAPTTTAPSPGPGCPPDVWDYLDGGSGAELTLARQPPPVRPGRAAAPGARRRVGLRHRRQAARRRAGHAGRRSRRRRTTGWCIPTARSPRRRRRRGGALFVVSIFASRTLEDIAAAATGPLWLQLYWLRRRDVLADLGPARARRRLPGAGAHRRRAAHRAAAARRAQRLRGRPDMRAGQPRRRDHDGLRTQHRQGASAIAAHAAPVFDPARDLGRPGLAARSAPTCRWCSRACSTAADADRAVEHGATRSWCPTTAAASSTARVPACARCPRWSTRSAGRCPVLLDGGRAQRHRRLRRAGPRRDAAVLVGRPAAVGAGRRRRGRRAAGCCACSTASWRTRWRWPAAPTLGRRAATGRRCGPDRSERADGLGGAGTAATCTPR